MENRQLSNFHSGLSGLQLPIPKYQYPAEHQNSSRLTYYATFFNSIEINSSFYKIPQKATLTRWYASVPDLFRFTFKLFKEITHCNELHFDPANVERFMQTIAHVGDKTGCLLVQFPPSLKSSCIYQLDALLNTIKNYDAENLWSVAVEFRDKSWYNDEVYDLLDSHHATMVVQDIPKSATPLRTTTADVIYIRFHGPTGNYRGSYTEAFLMEYAAYVNEWLSDGKAVYVYFNNTAGDAYQNAVTFHKYIHVSDRE